MFTDTDRALLDRPLHGLLTIPPGPQRLPAPRPVWFERTADDEIQLFSMADALKVRRLEAEPLASFVVITPGGEPEGWVSIEADVTLPEDGATDLALRLAERYWEDLTPERRDRIEDYSVEENLRRIVLHPRRVTRGPA
ncbi:pyridoxamine 5'-phosphate oxidase [Actinomycetospora succinea]|uniref:Pyridoxamine 5'-phosphate oxidase n=1 Tax=Actinomycetospora succinea TaxID=663603 RepID=A0A4V3DA85_9PSEU|nr:pyridoxamine 5'-phosphate oxidase family protein [Actinomycetospora succinea]TDQ60918.1 pyridoxamine 5'-phosphate oxidase [Actinomycetospora succinea]